MKISASIEGLDEMKAAILYLNNAEAKSVFRGGAAAGAKIVQRYAKAAGPGGGIGVKIRADGDSATADIGPLNKNWYYKFAERGTKTHGPKKKSRKMMIWKESGGRFIVAKRVRGIIARPFLGPALEDHLEEVQAAIVAGYQKRLAKVSK